MNPNPNNGAIPALRGYRKQFLYTLYRILIANKEEEISPEGLEDYSVTSLSKLAEVVQVKDLNSPLQLSDFKPKNKDSFFQRCLAFIKKGKSPVFQIVSFGELGQEFQVFQEKGTSVQIKEKLIGYGYDSTAIAGLLGALRIITVQEDKITEEVNKWLKDTLVATNPVIAFDLLHFWMYRLAEQQLSVNRAQLINKISEIGTFLNERHRFLSEFGHSIFQLKEEKDQPVVGKLQEQFNSGIAAQYAHILAGLDISRPEKMEAIHNAFEQHSLVIVHGASGQGKSTLAYRYLHEYYPSPQAYYIRSTTDLAQILSIAEAIKALARPFEEDFIIYLDVAPGDQNWLRLCLYLIDIPLCRVLVTIREEDLNRSDSPQETLDSWELSLLLTPTEAALIYDRYQRQFAIPHFLNFEDAWSRFGGEGPLLEFIYLLRQGERLEDRLANQLERIQRLAATENDSSQVELLRYLATAGAHDCRLDLASVLDKLSLNNAKRTISLFEDEYLFRTSTDGRYLEALHPVRARLMMKLLCDPVIHPEEMVLRDCFPLVIEEDWGNFILQYAYKFRWPDSMMNLLFGLIPKSWRTCQEVFSSLVWCSVRGYIDRNEQIIVQLREEFPLGFDLAMMMLLAPQVDLSVLEKIFSPERKEKLDALLTQFTPLEEFYSLVEKWLKNCPFPSTIDTTAAAELNGLGYILFWQNRLKIGRALEDYQLEQLKGLDTEILPIAPLANLLLGLQVHSDHGRSIAKTLLPGFLRKYQAHGKVVWIEEGEDRIKVHFVIPINEDASKTQNDSYNEKAMYLIRLIRKAYPFHSQYGSQGYGHRFSIAPLPYDDTCKNISADALPLPWITDAGTIFRNLNTYESRLGNWESFIQKLLESKEQITDTIEAILTGLKLLSKRKRLEKPWEIIPDYPRPQSSLSLPQGAVDRWGYTSDFTSESSLVSVFHDVPLLQVLFPKLKSHFKAIKDFHASVRNFLDQAHKSFTIKEISQDWTKNDWKEKEGKLKELGYAKDNFRLSKYNLHECVKQVDAYLEAIYAICTWKQQIGNHEQDTKFRSELLQLLTVWSYFIDLEPFCKTNLSRASQSWQQGFITEFEQKLHTQLKRLQQQEGLEDTEFIRSETTNGNWYILLYVKNWDQAVNCLNQMHGVLSKCLVPAPLQSNRRQVLSQEIHEIWIVPLFRDYIVSRNTIRFRFYHILDKKENELGVTLFGKVTDQMISELDLDAAWDHYPEFVSIERLHSIVQSFPLSLEYILQLESLLGRSNTGDIILEIAIMEAVKGLHELYQELPSLVKQLITAVELEMDQVAPCIPDQDMVTYLDTILQPVERIQELVDILAEEGVLPALFQPVKEMHQTLSNSTLEIALVYWSWLDLFIHQKLKG